MAEQQGGRRLDIQGLRAIASLLVASYHIWFGNVSGGVDVFFAVGGYLLAMSLLREIERTGGVHVPKTIWRNMKRLFPMSALVLLVCGTIAVIAAGPLGFERVLTDIFASATYWQNWRLAADATDYVAAGHDKSAFQHYWAMGAQGQFTWGVMIIAGVFALGAKRMRDKRQVFGWLLLAIAIASFVYALVRLAQDPVPTYYDTFARAWELALGGFAALVLTRIPLNGIVRAIMGIVGLGLVLTAGQLPPEWLQPGWVTFYPVVGALLILLAGEGDQSSPVARLLQLKPLVWLGGISYGLYLWHWPVMKGFIAAFPVQGQQIDVFEGTLILGVSILLSWGSYRLIALLHGSRAKPRRPILALAMPVIAVAAAAGILIAPAIQRDAIVDREQHVPVASDADALAEAVSAAAAEPSAPAPGAIVGEDGRSAEWLVDDCLTVEADDVARCFYDDSASDQEVWLVGDSQAVTWAPALRSALDGAADLQLLGRSMCPFTHGTIVEAQIGDFAQTCEAHASMVLDLAAERLPDVVVIAYGGWWVGNGYEDRPADTGEQLAAGTMTYVEQLHELGIATLWLDGPPPAPDPAVCLEAHVVGGDLAACSFSLQEAQIERHRTLGDALAAGGVAIGNTLPWFCDVEAAVCPLIVDGVPTWNDSTHMGASGSIMRGAAVADSLLPLLE